MKPIVEQAFESYKYFSQIFQENGEKANFLAGKIRDVIKKI